LQIRDEKKKENEDERGRFATRERHILPTALLPGSMDMKRLNGLLVLQIPETERRNSSSRAAVVQSSTFLVCLITFFAISQIEIYLSEK
jgi:hypothetical protein